MSEGYCVKHALSYWAPQCPICKSEAIEECTHKHTMNVPKGIQCRACGKMVRTNAKAEASAPAELDQLEGWAKKKDKKYDQGKPMVGLMKKDFARALMAVAEITAYGVEKYNQPGSWRLVENARERYEDALGRHDLQVPIEDYCPESGKLHASHRAWNALATLELFLTELEEKK